MTMLCNPGTALLCDCCPVAAWTFFRPEVSMASILVIPEIVYSQKGHFGERAGASGEGWWQ